MSSKLTVCFVGSKEGITEAKTPVEGGARGAGARRTGRGVRAAPRLPARLAPHETLKTSPLEMAAVVMSSTGVLH